MRIGVFDPYLDSLGGGEKYTLSVASCLSENHEVTVLWNDKKILEKAAQRFGLSFERVNLAENFFSDLSKPRRLLKSKNYDLIFYLSNGSIPVVLTKLMLHFQFPVEWVKFSLKTKIKISRVNKFICNSEFTKNFIDRKFGVNSLILYPPIDLEDSLSSMGISEKEEVILTVGRYNRLDQNGSFKKHEFLRESFKKMIETGFKGKLVLVISYMESEKENILRLKETVVGFPVEIVENANKDELKKLYQKAKVYWHAAGFGEDLQKHPERAEHFGITTVEAMLVGAVPVVINAGGQREIVSNMNNGFLWKTQKELIEKTTEIWKNRQLWEKLSKAACQSAKKFSGKRFCKEINEIINEI